MSSRWWMSLALVPIVAAGGCSSTEVSAKQAPEGFLAASPAPRPAGNEALARGAAKGVEGDAAPSPAPVPAADRLVIYRARFEILVSNVSDGIAKFLGWVEESGGYLELRENAAVTCRVPAARYRELTARVPSLGRVLAESQGAEDVTRQVMDLTLRIETATKSRERLMQLLVGATDTKALLEIEREVRRLTEEIEGMKGELKYLNQQVAYSTITVSFQGQAPEPRPYAARGSRFPWLNEVGPERVLEDF